MTFLFFPSIASRQFRMSPSYPCGFTLVELMIGILLALISIAMITQVFILADLKKRDVAGGSDAQQIATMAEHHLDVALRQAGSSMVRTDNVWGCVLKASRSGTPLLPRTTDFPAPFASVPKTLRVTPVSVIAADTDDPKSRDSDIILTMGGGAQAPGITFKATGPASASGIPVNNSNGFAVGDLLLLPLNGGVDKDCYIAEIASTFSVTYDSDTPARVQDTPKNIPLGGTFGASAGSTGIGLGSPLLDLGTTPQFYLFGVDSAKQTLNRYDLLQLQGLTISAPIGENVFLMRVLYGVDDGSNGGKKGDNIVDKWISPKEKGWTFDELQAGTAEAALKIDQIKALRVAFVTRATYTREGLSDADLTLFGSLGDSSLKQTVTLSNSEQRYRYQVYENVIPLLNMQTLARS